MLAVEAPWAGLFGDSVTEPDVPEVGADWCRCGPVDPEDERYYRRSNGLHGWWHPKDMGGCGGITQTG